MKDAAWIQNELKEFVKNCKENSRENRRQAKDCHMSEPKRAEFLEGGADAMDYAAKEVSRILSGKTSIEAMQAMLKKVQKKETV